MWDKLKNTLVVVSVCSTRLLILSAWRFSRRDGTVRGNGRWNCRRDGTTVPFWRRFYRPSRRYRQYRPDNKPWKASVISITQSAVDYFHKIKKEHRPKTGIPGPFGAKNWYVLKSSQKHILRALPLVLKAHCACFWPDKAQVHTRLSSLHDLQLLFVVF